MGRAQVHLSASLWQLCSPQPGQIIEILANDIPPDAELLTCSYNRHTDQFIITLASPSLPATVPWEPLPILQGPTLQVADKVRDLAPSSN